MTHDELLAKITEGDDNINFYALRAVVELHKPIDKYFPKWEYGQDGEWDAGGETLSCCKNCQANYPCDTIQAIEKELK